MGYVDFSELLNKYIVKIDKLDDEIYFYLTNGAEYKMYHENDCCEHVYIEDIDGDLNDLLHSRILQADESTKVGINWTYIYTKMKLEKTFS